MSSKKTIYSALPIVAAAYGEQFKVKVNIGGDRAYTDGQSIQIPNVPDDYPHMDAVWGYLAHEAAHVRFTEMAVLNQTQGKLHASLLNILEDCRIENAMIRLFPGTAKTLNETARYLLHAEHYQPVTAEKPPAAILTGFCLYWLQTKAVGQTVLQDHLQSAQSAFESIFPEGVVVRLNALLRKAVSLTSTQDAASLAAEIIKMIEEEKEEAEKQEQEQSDEESQNPWESGIGSQTDDSGQPGEQGSAEAPDTGQPDGKQPSQEKGKVSQMLQGVLGAGSDDLPCNAHDTLKKELQSVAQKEGDPHYQTVRMPSESHNNTSRGIALIKEVSSTTSKIRAQLYGLVQASQRVQKQNRRCGKSIDTRKLHRLQTGDTRVFLKAADKKAPNTAVHILVDRSGSMSGGPLDVARQAALAIAMALEAIPKVNPAVTFFGNNRANPVSRAVGHSERVKGNAGKFCVSGIGSTPMAEAIWYAAYALSKTREERKMLIVVTDGAPSSMSACHAVIKLCEQSGIETYGIGVNTQSIANLFQRSILIKDVTTLQQTLFGLMGRSLTVQAA